MSVGRDTRGRAKTSKQQSVITKSDIDQIVARLCDGDITKRDYVLWKVRVDDIDPYLEVQQEKMLFRKGVMAFLGIKEKRNTDPTDEDYLASIAHFKKRGE